jgi:alpha-mannosidase
MQYSTARRFFEAIDVKTAKLETVTGERPGLWLYIHGPTHHWAISAEREAGRLLPAAEAFSTVRALLDGSFAGYPAGRLEAAWMAAIYPDHGWGGKEGQVTDRLFRKKYELARDEGREVLNGALAGIASRIKPHPEKGVPLVIFNTLSWTRTDPVTALVMPQNAAFHLVDAEGADVPYQRIPSGSPAAPGAVLIEFIARDVPALGYKTLYLVEGAGPSPEKPAQAAGAEVLENDFYRIELAPGGVKRLYDKGLGRDVLDTGKFLGFEIFTMQSVGNGAGEFGRVQQPTMEGFDKLSLHRPSWQRVDGESGPLKTVYLLEQPLRNCTVRERLIVHNGIKKIDCEVSLLGWDGEPYREFRLALPVAAKDGQVAYEIPLGILEVGSGEAKGTGGPAYGNLVYDEELSDIRPREVQNFLYAGDGSFGVTLTTSVAVNDYKDPTDAPVPYPVLQPILLASRRSCHGEGNWYLQEGDHHYSFSVVSHASGWRNGYRGGIAAGSPLIVVGNPAAGPGAYLPEAKSFLPVAAPGIILSTMKKAENDDTVILRVYDIEGKDTETAVELFTPVKRAERTNLIEEAGVELKPRKGRLVLPVGHHAVETLKLFPDWSKK